MFILMQFGEGAFTLGVSSPLETDMRLPLALLASILLTGPALAQSGFSSGGVANSRAAAQRQIPGEALNARPELAPRAGTTAADRLTRQQIQQRQGQGFSSSGLARNAAPPPPSALTHVPGGSTPPRR